MKPPEGMTITPAASSRPGFATFDVTMRSVVHACPPEGAGGLMPCCGRTPFEVPRWHRMTAEDDRVTCATSPAPDPVGERGEK
jgi:hypothetical protein